MNDHSYYEELTALAGGGFLSDQEIRELRDHLAVCAECRRSEREYRDLVRSGLPLVRSDRFEFMGKFKARPEKGVRERFLDRVRREGIRFSLNVEKPDSRRWMHLGFRAALAGVAAVVVLAAVFYGPMVSRRQASPARAQREIDRLKSENADLTARLAKRDQLAATQQNEIRDLRGQIANAAKNVGIRRDSEQKGVRIDQSTSQTAHLLDELQNRENQLADATSEIARINQLRASDQATLIAQQVHINEISDQLRVANATLDMERQLVAEGRDIRELLAARQLHVVDVRDMDANGKPGPAFARVFLTEGKSLTFYAFDLNEGRVTNAKGRFQVWGQQLASKNSVRSLGFLYVDDKAQKRWTLKISNPDLLKEINSVFVTVSTPAGDSMPTGQRLLYAYLGEPNHP
jgi:Tfp pilus assembly protein PilN